jgi:hypothetical protein
MFIILIMYTIISLVVPSILYLCITTTVSAYSVFVILYSGAIYFLCDSSLWITDMQFIHFVILLKYRFSVLNDNIISFTVSSLHRTTLNQPLKPSASDTISSSFETSSLLTTKSTLRKVFRHHNPQCNITVSVNRIYSS